MKRYLFLLLTFVCCSMLVACMASKPTNETLPDTNNQEEVISEDTEGDNDTQELENEKSEADQETGESEDTSDVEDQVVIENDGFKVYTPAPDSHVEEIMTVRGMTNAFEGTFQYAIEDGHFIFDTGTVTATEGDAGWRNFEFTIDLTDLESGPYHLVLYELSAKDGSVIHELMYPIQREN